MSSHAYLDAAPLEVAGADGHTVMAAAPQASGAVKGDGAGGFASFAVSQGTLDGFNVTFLTEQPHAPPAGHGDGAAGGGGGGGGGKELVAASYAPGSEGTSPFAALALEFPTLGVNGGGGSDGDLAMAFSPGGASDCSTGGDSNSGSSSGSGSGSSSVGFDARDPDQLGQALETYSDARAASHLFPTPGDMAAYAGSDFLYPFPLAPTLSPPADASLEPAREPAQASGGLMSPAAGSGAGLAALAPPAGLPGPPSPPDLGSVTAAAGELGAGAGASPAPRKRKAAAADLRPEAAKRHVNGEVARRHNLARQFSHLANVTDTRDTTQAGILQAAVKALAAYEERVRSLELEVRSESARLGDLQRRAQDVRRSETTEAVNRARAQAASDGADVQYKAFLHAGVAMSVSLLNGQIVDVNEEYEELMKNDRAVLTNLSVFTISHPDFTPKCYQMVNSLITEEAVVEQGRAKIINCSGEILTVHCAAWTVRVDDKPKFIVSMITPIEAVPSDVASTNGPQGLAAV